MEMESIDLGGNLYEDNKPTAKKDEFPQYYLSLFDNEVCSISRKIAFTLTYAQTTPDITTPSGYSIFATLRDLINIYEVNRKECARLLLDLPRWFTRGTFKPKPGTTPNETEPAAHDKSWQIESLVIEVCFVFVSLSIFFLRTSTRQYCR